MADGDSDAEAIRLRERLRQVREYLNLSQQFVADRTGLLRSAIADIERGARRVDSLELQKLAKLYGYPMSYFVEDEHEVPEASTVRALTRAAGELTEADREEILRFAEFLKHRGRAKP